MGLSSQAQITEGAVIWGRACSAKRHKLQATIADHNSTVTYLLKKIAFWNLSQNFKAD